MAARISCGVGFPKWNPQSEFTSDEENSTFQGIFMPMDTLHPKETGAAKLTLQSKVLDHTVYTSSNLVKILILTKGVDFFGTLMPWFPTATDYQKIGFYTFVEPRKGLGNEGSTHLLRKCQP